MIKVAFNLLFIMVLSIIFFAESYKYFDNLHGIDAYYHSTMIQTLVGDEYKNISFNSKLLTIIHAVFAYSITTGIIIWLFHNA